MAVISAEKFLGRISEMQTSGTGIDDILDYMFQSIDDMMQNLHANKEDLKYVLNTLENIFVFADPVKLGPNLAVGLLMITYPIRNDILSRAAFRETCIKLSYQDEKYE